MSSTDFDLDSEMDKSLKLTAAASLFAFGGPEGDESGGILLFRKAEDRRRTDEKRVAADISGRFQSDGSTAAETKKMEQQAAVDARKRQQAQFKIDTQQRAEAKAQAIEDERLAEEGAAEAMRKFTAQVVVGSAEDEKRKKRLEKQLQQLHKLEALVAA
jgi:hypothetical protein